MLTSENRTRDAHEPSGEPESLWGKMRNTKMGDRVQYGRPEADEKKKKKEEAAKKKRQQQVGGWHCRMRGVYRKGAWGCAWRALCIRAASCLHPVPPCMLLPAPAHNHVHGDCKHTAAWHRRRAWTTLGCPQSVASRAQQQA